MRLSKSNYIDDSSRGTFLTSLTPAEIPWLFVQLKCSRNVKTKMDITVKKIAGRFGDKTFFNHSPGIREVKLENVSACFDIKTDGDRILDGTVVHGVKLIIVLGVKRKSFSKFQPPSGPEGENIVRILLFDNGISVDERWGDLQGKRRRKFPGDDHLIGVRQSRVSIRLTSRVSGL